MKKILVIGTIAAVALIALAAAGFAYAQSQTPPAPAYPGYGPGMMGGYGGMMGGSGGMMGGGWDGQTGPMHDSMIAAFADVLDLTPEELQDRLTAGETLWQIAEAQGISEEEFGELWFDAHTAALEQAVADGLITQEQADWMSEHMRTRTEAGFGPGSGPCNGAGMMGGFGQGMRWGRGNNQ
jgi:hypothetical protein